ncbi:Trypanosomal VSG domain [Trypanosoma vivax]|nr:Trypanosomal VSG domain [Trypanosoma vivax]
MQRLFCTCAFLLAAASVAALAADPGPGSNAAEFAVLCGAYRAAKAVKDSAERMRAGIESLEAVGREGHVAEETGGPGSGDGIGPNTGVGEARTRSPRAVAESLAKLAERYAMQAIYGSKQAGNEHRVPDAEDETNALLTMLRASTDTNGGFDEEGNDEGLILPMILLCNDGTSGNKSCGTSGGTTCPCSTAPVDNGSLENTEAKGRVWSVLKATSGTTMDSDKDLIIGNWLITKHICENHTTHARSLGTANDLAGQLEAAAHAIVHAMKPSGKTAGYNQQKMCLGQVVSNQACDGDKSSGAYACACFDKAAAANRGQGIKFINHLLAAANALRRLQRLRDDVTRHNATITAIEKHRLSAKEKRADTGNAGKINTSARAGKGEQEQQTNVAAGKGAAATTESACEKMGGQWDAHRQACSRAGEEAHAASQAGGNTAEKDVARHLGAIAASMVALAGLRAAHHFAQAQA